MKKTIKFFAASLLSLALFTSCSDDDSPSQVNENEVITRVEITLTPQGGGDTVTLSYVDADGDGPGVPVAVGGTILGNTTYSGAITFWNDLEDPAENVTLEIMEEDDEHQIFFSLSGSPSHTFAYNDTDDNNLPVGLSFTLTTTGTDAGVFNFFATLIHEPNKNGENVSNGDITNAGGSTDIEAIIPLTIVNPV